LTSGGFRILSDTLVFGRERHYSIDYGTKFLNLLGAEPAAWFGFHKNSRLQLDVHNLSLGKRHLVNACELTAGIGVIAGKTV